MNLYESTLRPGRWHENNEEWDSDRYALEYLSTAMKYVRARWATASHDRQMAQVVDLQGVAIETLVTGSRDWFDWCDETSNDPTNKILFWWFMKKRITWDVLNYLERDTEVNADVSDRNLEARTQLHYRPQDESHLLREIAALIGTLPTHHQITLAMYYFEEMQRGDIAQLFGVSDGAVGKWISAASTAVLHFALAHTTEAQSPELSTPSVVRIPAAVHAWTQQRYGVDADVYVRWLVSHYSVDVTYAVDIIGRANGVMRRRDGEASGRRLAKLTDDQVRQILHELKKGTKTSTIAAEHAISQRLVNRIKTGDKYAWVAP